MKPEEKGLLENFIATHPDFLGVKSWIEGPEPPDALITDEQGRVIGVELTEWLTDEQMTISVAREERERGWFTVLDSERHSSPQHFAFVVVNFRADMKAPRGPEDRFVREFYGLMSRIDGAWEREMGRDPQKIWTDFPEYPSVGRQVGLLRFFSYSTPRQITNSAKWVMGSAKGGAYNPREATNVLLDRIDDKKRKANYGTLKVDLGLSELVLLVHYGLRGLLHNTPIEGLNWKLEDHVFAAHLNLAADHGPFDRAFLYLAYNEGKLFTLYP